MGHTTFTRGEFAAFRANNRLGAMQMLNLVRRRDVARYEDGRDNT